MAATDAVAALLESPTAPLGVVVGVADRDGRRLAAGGLRRPSGEPVTDHTRFDLASVTKIVTTCALHRLAVLGELTFADPVERYLPQSGCAPRTTLSDLLTHRAGLWEWQPLYLGGPEPLPQLAGLPLRYRPGQARHYSDLGFMLLGAVVAAVTASDLREAVAALVARPLALNSLGYGPVDAAAAEVAAGGWGDRVEQAMVASGEPYPVLIPDAGFAWREELTVGEANDGNAFHAFGGASGHAGLFADAGDLLTLASSLASPDAEELWGAGVRAEVFADGPDAGQALGWRSMAGLHNGRSVRMLWHPGFTGCAVGFVPDDDYAVVMLTNRLLADRRPETGDLWTAVLANVQSGRRAGEDADHDHSS